MKKKVAHSLGASGLRTGWSYGSGPLMSMPGGNGGKHLSGSGGKEKEIGAAQSSSEAFSQSSP